MASFLERLASHPSDHRLSRGQCHPTPDHVGGVVATRDVFAGYWEYLLDQAIFTAPVYEDWAGAALVGPDGKLLGVGSLYIEDTAADDRTLPGNMFVPINLLKPILGDLLADGRA
ncbi:MAG: hypothetical protein VCC99_03230, partial [Alphaproteobacteria bacterium]